MKDVINRQSEYIWLNSALDSTGTKRLQNGSNSNASIGNYLTGFDAFEDKDTLQVDFLIAPQADSGGTLSTLVNDLVATAGTTRKDCVVVTSPARDTVVGVSDPVTDTTSDAGNLTYSSYLFMDNNYLKVYDKYNDKYVTIPAASSTAGIMAASDANAAPWFSPAGSRRGAYVGVTSLAYTPTKAQRDTLYKAGINPVANLPGQGVLLYGDKTHLNRPSAFDRINVRRLFNVVERAIGVAARNTLFELNDEFTRAEFVNIVEPFLREIKGRRGITDFRVVCDETNNTPSIVDRNEFIANIFIKPARSINYITLNFVAVRSGVDFEEVAGRQV
jgi:phage tail sheath protein FI